MHRAQGARFAAADLTGYRSYGPKAHRIVKPAANTLDVFCLKDVLHRRIEGERLPFKSEKRHDKSDSCGHGPYHGRATAAIRNLKLNCFTTCLPFPRSRKLLRRNKLDFLDPRREQT